MSVHYPETLRRYLHYRKKNDFVVIKYGAEWCGPCKQLAPALEKLAKEYAGNLLVAKVNTDENPEWANKFGVQGIPTMLFVSDGNIVHRQTGALPEPMLRDAVVQFMDVVDQKKINGT